MRMAYLDCFAGISGDMLLGALVDAGVPREVLTGATAALGLGASLEIRRVDRSGITATKVDVMEGGRLAEEVGRDEQHTHTHQEQPKTQHLHKGGHDHDHHHHEQEVALRERAEQPKHHHAHGRSLTAIRRLIAEAALPEAVRAKATRTFELLGLSEAKIHNVPVDDIHFHEVGAVDAIVDIVAASAGVHWLEQEAERETGEPLQWHCSPLNVGSGTVHCAHGVFPVPAPATADLLRGAPTYAAHVEQELVTPTGAALVRAIAPSFGPQPAMRVERIGYGAGGRDPKGFANVLRLSIGEADRRGRTPAWEAEERLANEAGAGDQAVVVLETALDDCNPQVVAYVAEMAAAGGALDVMSSAVGMKKGRQGTLLTVLCAERSAEALTELLLRETTTLGVRRRVESRRCLTRRYVTVETQFGAIRVKVGAAAGKELNAQPEFEDCRTLALQRGVPVKQVIGSAAAAYVEARRRGA